MGEHSYLLAQYCRLSSHDYTCNVGGQGVTREFHCISEHTYC